MTANPYAACFYCQCISLAKQRLVCRYSKKEFIYDKVPKCSVVQLLHLSRFGWERSILKGDCLWRQHKLIGQGTLRPLRMFAEASRTMVSVL